MAEQDFRNEWDFNRAVQNLAEQYGWKEPFHIPQVAYKTALERGLPIPAGFPDLILRYQDVEGASIVIAAELKTDDDERSRLQPWQKEFLLDLAQHLPTFVLRPRDWDYIERILRDGPPEASGQIIEPSPLAIRSKEWLPPQQTIDVIVYRLVTEISSPAFPRGNLAELRQMNPEEPDSAAFYQLMGARGLLRNETLETKWAMIIHGIALMTPTAHHSGTPVGEALFEGGVPGRTSAFYSGLRLNRLLKSEGSVLVTLTKQLFLMMKVANQPFDWREMATLILSEGIDSEAAEESRRIIARSYYGTEYKNSR